MHPLGYFFPNIMAPIPIEQKNTFQGNYCLFSQFIIPRCPFPNKYDLQVFVKSSNKTRESTLKCFELGSGLDSLKIKCQLPCWNFLCTRTSKTLKNDTKSEPPYLSFNCFLPWCVLLNLTIHSTRKTRTQTLLKGGWKGSLFFCQDWLKHKQIGNNFFDKATQVQYFTTSFLTKKRRIKLFATSKLTVNYD